MVGALLMPLRTDTVDWRHDPNGILTHTPGRQPGEQALKPGQNMTAVDHNRRPGHVGARVGCQQEQGTIQLV